MSKVTQEVTQEVTTTTPTPEVTSIAQEGKALLVGTWDLLVLGGMGGLKLTNIGLSAAAKDGIPLVASAAEEFIPFVKELCKLPLCTPRVGYMMDNGASREEAEEAAYRVINQPISETVREIGEGTGVIASKGWAAFAAEKGLES